MLTPMKTHEQDHLALGTKLDAYRGDELGKIPCSLDNGTCAVVLIGGMPAQLTLHDCVRLAAFFSTTAKQVRDAQMRAYYLTRPDMEKAPNLCKSCGHLNHPDVRGWCTCEHCGAWMDRGPFPGQSQEEHARLADRRDEP